MSTIREQLNKYIQFRGKDLARDGKVMPGYVENMCWEFYNKGTETVTFTNIHPEKARGFFLGLAPSFWERLDCPPGEWVFLPHRMYAFSCPSGNQQYPGIVNVGDAMFKGNTQPSRPELRKNSFSRKII